MRLCVSGLGRMVCRGYTRWSGLTQCCWSVHYSLISNRCCILALMRKGARTFPNSAVSDSWLKYPQLYFGVGYAYGAFVLGQTGMAALPNSEFWASVTKPARPAPRQRRECLRTL